MTSIRKNEYYNKQYRIRRLQCLTVKTKNVLALHENTLLDALDKIKNVNAYMPHCHGICYRNWFTLDSY